MDEIAIGGLFHYRIRGRTMNNEIGKILVVDDIVENCDILKIRMEKVGYDVDTETDSNQAIDRLRASEYDLVLLDINMPGTSGITLLEQIRGDEAFDSVAVIMITAIDDVQVALDCMRKGACGYLTKPFNIDQIRQQINNCFKRVTEKQVSGAAGA
jgi:DNA-binding response OmpR family regulator